MRKVNITHGKQIILAGDFHLFFDSNLEAKGDKPILKEKSVARMIELKEEYDFYDIWRIRNQLKKSFTIRQNLFPGTINRRLDYIFISNTFQESFNEAIILPAFKTNHSPVSVIISNCNEIKPGPGLWKFNKSLISDESFTEKITNFIENLKEDLNT